MSTIPKELATRAAVRRTFSISPAGEESVVFLQWEIFEFIVRVLTLVQIIIAIFANFTVIAFYLRNLGQNTVHTFYLCNLALSDFLCGVLVMVPVYVSEFDTRDWRFGERLCRLDALLLYGFQIQGTTMVIMICYDRLLLIQNGMRYRDCQKPGTAKTCVSLLWLTTMIAVCIFYWRTPRGEIKGLGFVQTDEDKSYCEFLPHDQSPFMKTLTTILATLPPPLMLYLHVQLKAVIDEVVAAVRRGSSSTTVSFNGPSTIMPAELQPTIGAASPDEESVDIDFGTPSRRSKYRWLSQARENYDASKLVVLELRSKGNWILASSFVAFFICWVPFTVLLCVLAWTPLTLNHCLQCWSIWPFLLKSTLNPFLYARHAPAFRRSYSQLVVGLRDLNSCCRTLCFFACFFCVDQTQPREARPGDDVTFTTDLADQQAKTSSTIEFLWRDPVKTNKYTTRHSMSYPYLTAQRLVLPEDRKKSSQASHTLNNSNGFLCCQSGPRETVAKLGPAVVSQPADSRQDQPSQDDVIIPVSVRASESHIEGIESHIF